MAPTVFITDISCSASDTDTEPDTIILDFGPSDLRVRRNHTRERRALTGRAADGARRPDDVKPARRRRRHAGLLDITVRTVALIRRNQLLQARLSALQRETLAFVQSVLDRKEDEKRDSSDESDGSSGEA